MTKEEPRNEFCPRCERLTEAALVSTKENLTVLGELVEYTARVYKCGTCGEEFAPPDLEEQNFKRAYDLYRKRHNLVTSRQIKAIRETYGLSQRSFARFLGWGQITIHRYEAGAIQDIAHNQTLVLIKDNAENVRKIFELNRNNLSESLRQKVEERIKALIGRDGESKRKSLESLIAEKASGTEPTIDSGYKALDAKKLENLILYLLRNIRGVFKTKLNKLLWYCDFYHFKEYGVSMTGTRYQHLPYGPVPDNYDLYLWILSTEKKIEGEEIIFEDKSGEFFRAIAHEDLSTFTKEELGTMKYVVRKLGKLNAQQISERSHEEAAYKGTRQSETIPYSFAEQLSI
jgi:putative zinc finger/helix-turn-helix YgiT family protein